MKSNKQRKQKKTKTINLLALSKQNFTFTLNLSQTALNNLNIDPSSIKEPKDLAIIIANKSLWDMIQLSGPEKGINDTIDTLLYMNRCTPIKYFTQILAINKVELKEEELFLKDFIEYVTEHNYIFIDETHAAETDGKINFVLKSDMDLLASVTIGSQSESANDPIRFENFAFDIMKQNYFYFDLTTIFDGKNNLEETLSGLITYIEAILENNKKLKIIFKIHSICYTLMHENNEMNELLIRLLKLANTCLIDLNLTVFDENNRIITANYKDSKQSIEAIFKKVFKNQKQKHGIILTHHDNISYLNNNIIDEYDDVRVSSFRTNENQIISSFLKRNIFWGGFLGGFLNNNQQFYFGLQSAISITQKCLDKVDIALDKNFYHVKLNKEKILQFIESRQLSQKEDKFKLDSNNLAVSELKYYNPLFDNNLNQFFTSKTVRKDLKNHNLINESGYVVYDYNYKEGYNKANMEFLIAQQRLDLIKREKSRQIPKLYSSFDDNNRIENSNLLVLNKKLPSLAIKNTEIVKKQSKQFKKENYINKTEKFDNRLLQEHSNSNTNKMKTIEPQKLKNKNTNQNGNQMRVKIVNKKAEPTNTNVLKIKNNVKKTLNGCKTNSEGNINEIKTETIKDYKHPIISKDPVQVDAIENEIKNDYDEMSYNNNNEDNNLSDRIEKIENIDNNSLENANNIGNNVGEEVDADYGAFEAEEIDV